MSYQTVLVRARARISRACVRAYVRVRTRLCAYVCVHVRACVRTCAYVRAISPPIRISLSGGEGYARASLTPLTSPQYRGNKQNLCFAALLLFTSPF